MKAIMETTDNLRNRPIRRDYPQLLRYMFKEMNETFVWYSDEALHELFAVHPRQKEFFEKSILPLAKENKKENQQEKRNRMNIHKEGIVMNVYHPKNVERWLNEGGYELLDMMF